MARRAPVTAQPLDRDDRTTHSGHRPTHSAAVPTTTTRTPSGPSASRVSPLRDLTSAVSSLGQGDYDRRASVTGGAEVAHLAETFNAMATAIGGLVATGETIVDDAEQVATSYPGFVAAMTTLGATISAG